MATSEAAAGSLKRLDFIPHYTGVAIGLGESTYKTVRGYTPQFADGYVKNLEDTIANVGAPIVTKAQDTSAKLLRTVDEQVDATVNTGYNYYNTGLNQFNSAVGYSKALHEDSLKNFAEARDSYYKFVEENVNYVTKVLSPSAVVQTARDAVHHSLDTARELSDPDKALETVHNAWLQFSSVPIVASVLKTTDPALKFGERFYFSLHDYVVANKLYKGVYDTTAATAAKLPDTFVYKVSKERLYPLVAGYVDPAYDKLVNSKVVHNLADHIKPVAAA